MLESVATGKKVEGCFGLRRLLESFPAEESHWFLGPMGALGNHGIHSHATYPLYLWKRKQPRKERHLPKKPISLFVSLAVSNSPWQEHWGGGGGEGGGRQQQLRGWRRVHPWRMCPRETRAPS